MLGGSASCSKQSVNSGNSVMECMYYDVVEELMNLMAVGMGLDLRSGCAQIAQIISAVDDPIFHEVPMIYKLYLKGLYHKALSEEQASPLKHSSHTLSLCL